MSNLHLITRADDLGSFRAANHAILDAVTRGICRNVGVMVPCPAFAEAAELFRGRRDVCLGLHSTLNAEWSTVRWGPVLPPRQVPCLVEADGTLKRTPQEIFDGGADLGQMLAEVRAQLDRARAAGLRIEYLDAHMGPGWIHAPAEPHRRFEGLLADLAQREGLVFLGHSAPRSAADCLIQGRPVERLNFKRIPGHAVEALCAALATSEGVRLFVTHPAMPEEEMQPVCHASLLPGQVARARAADWQMLVDPRVIACCRDHGVQLIRMTDV